MILVSIKVFRLKGPAARKFPIGKVSNSSLKRSDIIIKGTIMAVAGREILNLQAIGF